MDFIDFWVIFKDFHFFAQNAIPIGKLDGETIQLGDSVKILERGDPVYR